MVIDCRPGDSFAFRFSVEIEGVVIVCAFRWLRRLQRWVCVLRAPDGTHLTTEQVVQPGGGMAYDTADDRLPTGRIYWRGPDDYERTDLGASLRMLYIPADAAPERLSYTQILSRLGFGS